MLTSFKTLVKKWRASRDSGHQLDALLAIADKTAPYPDRSEWLIELAHWIHRGRAVHPEQPGTASPLPSTHKNPLHAQRAGPQPSLEEQRRRHPPRAPTRKRRPLAPLRCRHARALRLLRRPLRAPRSLPDPARAKPPRSASNRHADVQPGTRRRMDRQSAHRSAHPHPRALRLRTGRQRTTRHHPVLARPAGRPAQPHLPDQLDRSVANRPQPSR